MLAMSLCDTYSWYRGANMAKLDLTDKTLKRLHEVMAEAGIEPPVVYWDSATPGLSVRVWKTGAIVWTFKGRVGGRQVMKRLGEWPAMRAEAARAKVLGWRDDIRSGENPIPVRFTPKTWDDVLDKFEGEHLPTLKPKTQESYKSAIRVHLRGAFGDRITVQAITHSDVRDLYMRIGGGGKERTANVVLMLLKMIFDRCEYWGFRPVASNPVAHLRKGSFKAFTGGNERERELTDDELERIGAALAQMEAGGYMQFVAFVRVLLFSGARRGEALALRWDRIDEARKTIRWDDTKTGRTKKPLNDALFEVLAGLPRLEDCPWVFPSDSSESGHLEDIKRPWKRLLELAKVEDLRRHDLRHNLGNVAADEGLNMQTVASLLGHKDTGTTERYSKTHRGLDASNRVTGKIKAKLRGGK